MFKNSRAVIAGIAVVVALSGCATATAAVSPGAEKYLSSVKGVWIGAVPTDAELVDYGKAACDSLEAGTAIPDVAVIPDTAGKDLSVESSGPVKNNWHVVRFAPAMCP